MATIRQKKLAKKLIENGGKSVSATMLEVGYTEGYAHNPQKITQKKSWAELMEQYLPDDLIAERHHALLEKKDKDGQPHTDVKGAIAMAHDLKGYVKPKKVEFSGEFDLSKMTYEQLARIAKGATIEETNATASDGGDGETADGEIEVA